MSEHLEPPAIPLIEIMKIVSKLRDELDVWDNKEISLTIYDIAEESAKLLKDLSEAAILKYQSLLWKFIFLLREEMSLLRETVVFEMDSETYKIEIIGTDVMDIIDRTDILKKFLIENICELNIIQLRKKLYYKFGTNVSIFYPTTNEWKRNS